MANHPGKSRRRTPRRIGSVCGVIVLLAGLCCAEAVARGTAGLRPDSARTCSDLDGARFGRAEVTSAVANDSGTFVPPPLAQTGQATITALPAFCDVRLSSINVEGVRVRYAVWLPRHWNGRFQGVGGGGFACGPAFENLAQAIKEGYASGSTDCGIVPADAASAVGLTGPWALRADGSLNWPLIRTFASVGIHDMTTIGKAVVAGFYNHRVALSYFVGCSGGGREALMEAQRYPTDYDGILAGAPTTYWTELSTSLIWAQLVMKEAGDFLPSCKQAAFTAAAVAACDGDDGVRDGIIGDPTQCRWNPRKLVGTVTPCGTITEVDASVVRRIWQGATSSSGRSLWYGTLPGAALDGLGLTASSDGMTTGQPFAKALSWMGTWLLKDPNWDWTTLSFPVFQRLFVQAQTEFSGVLDTDDADLDRFARAGGKLILWDGYSDQYLFPQGTIQYYRSVLRQSSSAGTAVRLFMAPGVGHCNIGNVGPALVRPLDVLTAWRETGSAPDSIRAERLDAEGAVVSSRPVCRYPLVARYHGGDPNSARSFSCARTFGAQAKDVRHVATSNRYR